MLFNKIYTEAVFILYTLGELIKYTIAKAYRVGARERCRKPNRNPNCKLRKMSSFLRFYLTKRILVGIMVATEFGKPTDGADYAEPLKGAFGYETIASIVFTIGLGWIIAKGKW